jgi:hypothetical protein
MAFIAAKTMAVGGVSRGGMWTKEWLFWCSSPRQSGAVKRGFRSFYLTVIGRTV